MKRLVVYLTSLTFVACGLSSTGVDPGKNLDNLSANERQSVCEYMHEVGPPDGEYNCVGGQRTIERDLSACLSRGYWGGGREDCTVAALEACYDVLADAGTWCGLDLVGPCESAPRCGFSAP